MQRDLPLWARGLAGVLLVGASLWVLHIEVLRSVAGDSIAVVALGIVSVSSLRGMHLPLGLWPDGPWRTRFSVGLVVGVALAFALLVVASDPASTAAFAPIDPGVFALVMLGVVAWGMSWAFVRQLPSVQWYGAATAAGLLPLMAGLVEGAATPEGVCLVAVDPIRGCTASALRVFLFYVPVYAAVSVLTVDLTFRRFLIGWPDRANAALVLASALLFGLWAALVGADVPLFQTPWWVAILAATAAGAIYALSGSLLVASYLTALLYAAQMALRTARPTGDLAHPAVTGWGFGVALGVSAAVLMAELLRRRGLPMRWTASRGGN